MVHISFKLTDEAVYYIDEQFHVDYEKTWVLDPLAREIAENVDKVKFNAGISYTTSFGRRYSPSQLSVGVKTLLLLLFKPEYQYCVTNCGDNCAKWILEIGRKHDINIVLTRIMNFGENFTVLVNGIEINSMPQLISAFEEEFF